VAGEKRLFTLSATGRAAIEQVKTIRNKLFEQLPPLAIGLFLMDIKRNHQPPKLADRFLEF